TGLRVPVGMHKALREYEQYARERRHLRSTSLAERMHNIAVFLDFLRTRGLESLDTLQAEDLSAFVRSRAAWNPRTVSRVTSCRVPPAPRYRRSDWQVMPRGPWCGSRSWSSGCSPWSIAAHRRASVT